MNIIFDEGYCFGLGVFETISVIENHAVLLEYHLERLRHGAGVFNLKMDVTEESVHRYIKKNPMKNGVLKIIVSEKNTIYQCRDNNYTEDIYKSGFTVMLSSVIRNETSVFTYVKSLNYGDNLLEKRSAHQRGYDEPIFLNSRGQLTEGATTNIFFIKDKKIVTPSLSCGMLDGTIRKYIMNKYDVEEKVIYHHEVCEFDEMFVTNSLIGVMPVYKFEQHIFKESKQTDDILREYLKIRKSL